METFSGAVLMPNGKGGSRARKETTPKHVANHLHGRSLSERSPSVFTKKEGHKLIIRNWMKLPVRTVKPHDSVAQARALLAEHQINQLPVVQHEKLVGIVTDRDLRDAPEAFAISSQPAGTDTPAGLPNPAEIYVEDVMTVSLVTLSPDDTVERAAQLMLNDRIGGIPIVEENRLVAMLTRTDVLQAFLSLSRQQSMGKILA
jgi:acetoin utilization protein AcuB